MRKCSVEGCKSTKYHARGFCKNHYMTWWLAHPELVKSRKHVWSKDLRLPDLSRSQQINLCSLVRSLR